MKKLVVSLWNDESGQGLTEYALLLGLIALVVIALLIIFGERLQAIYQAIVDALNTVPTPIDTGG
jgi:pilus assembly protein Flp/PilA